VQPTKKPAKPVVDLARDDFDGVFDDAPQRFAAAA
jgi:hypothetical protein